MKEIQDIIVAFDKAQEEDKQTALATVVHVEGSSYRRPGARMLITEDGQLTGAISGGCLEGDALRKALLTMQEGKAKLVTYDTMDEDDAKLGVQLGCNGIIHILIEPINSANANNPVQLLKKFLSQRQKGVIVTLFSFKDRLAHQPGTCLLHLQNETVACPFSDAALQEALIADAKIALQNQISSIKTYTSAKTNFTAFIEFIKPVIAIVITGAGNDAMPLMEMATILGWYITMVDGRPNYATRQRFSKAHQIIVAKPEAVLPQLFIDEQTVFVLMTHNYNYDKAMLRQLVLLNTDYIGVLGPKKKLNLMLEDLEQDGFRINNDQLSKIYGPVGLDIGAETAEEIALSIAAEIKAVLAGKKGKFLRDKEDAIHSHFSQAITHVNL